MNYRIVFLKNEVAACKPTETQLPANHRGDIYYEHDPEKRRLIYAIIRAATKDEAIKKAQDFAERYNKN